MLLLETIKLALNDLRLHALRSVLTAMGIIFGVAAVITMVSLGEGSKREALLQIERLGARNIILRSERPAEASDQQGGQQRSFINRYGITRDDFDVILANFPNAETIVPLKEVGSQLLRGSKVKTSQSFGTTPDLPEVAGVRVARGIYIDESHMADQAMVAVIGAELARYFFPAEDPVGETIRIDEKALTIVGVLEPVGLSNGAGGALVGRDLNFDLHLPITTAKAVFGDTFIRRESGSFSGSEVEISEVYLESPNRESVLTDSGRLKRIMEVRHPGMSDLTMVVPYELLEQARKTATTYTLVFGTIAGIALLVGGIGIMNIMLATVQERIREIGIRRAMGATRHHILTQFIIETGVISTIGGLAGIALGIGLSVLLPNLSRWGLLSADTSFATQITLWSIGLAFGVATVVGLMAGLYPAIQAARHDPIVALRHD